MNTRAPRIPHENGYPRAPMILRALFLAVLAVLPGCIDGESVDYAFCEGGEACFTIPGTTSTEPVVACGGVVCNNGCYVGWHCGPENDCQADDYAPGWDDNDACTIESCQSGQWTHTPINPSSYDDHDPCTVDQCNPGIGVIHTNTCG